MSDHTPETEDTSPEASPGDQIDHSRRKLTGAALGVSAVFTLASRPVWANQCTISGMASGNLSADPNIRCSGCTPGYWKQPQHLDAWPAGINTTDTFNSVFGVSQYVKNDGVTPYTLLEVLRNMNGNNDPISPNLAFHACAALLNAAHPDVNFGYTAGEIITLFQNNYASNAEALKDSLDMLNDRACPLS